MPMSVFTTTYHEMQDPATNVSTAASHARITGPAQRGEKAVECVGGIIASTKDDRRVSRARKRMGKH